MRRSLLGDGGLRAGEPKTSLLTHLRHRSAFSGGDNTNSVVGCILPTAGATDAAARIYFTPNWPLRRATRTIPIVFVIVPDPVGAGFVEGLARPGSSCGT